MAHKKFVWNLNSLMTRGAFALIAVLSASVISSCGGSGGGVAASTALTVGALDILPNGGNLYAGVPFQLTIAGGTKPYFLTSNEQTVLPLNVSLSGNTITLLANNPGVVDVNGDPNIVPFRTATITVRDAGGTVKTADFKVLQNFLTGYSLSVTSIGTCGTSGCAGFESLINLRPTSAGLLQVNRQLSLSIIQGEFSFYANPNAAPNTPGTLVQTVTVSTGPSGSVTARLFVPVTAITQYAKLRVTDVISGSYQDLDFVITAVPSLSMTALPAAIPTLVGSNTQNCGSGSANVIISGGKPPYTAVTTSTLITVSPTVLATSGGSYTINVSGGAPPNCTTGSVSITDSAVTQNRLTVNVTTQAGTVVPVQPLAISPTTLCIADGSTGRAVITGGGTTIALNSSNTGLVTATGSPALTLTAVGGAPAPYVAGVTNDVTVTATDGATTASITVNRKATCP